MSIKTSKTSLGEAVWFWLEGAGVAEGLGKVMSSMVMSERFLWIRYYNLWKVKKEAENHGICILGMFWIYMIL